MKLGLEKAVSLCKYAIQTSLFEGLGKKYTPFTMVMGAISLSENILKVKLEMKLQPTMRVSKSEITECFKDMCIMLQGNNKFELTALKRKYGKSRNHQVAKLKINLND